MIHRTHTRVLGLGMAPVRKAGAYVNIRSCTRSMANFSTGSSTLMG